MQQQKQKGTQREYKAERCPHCRSKNTLPISREIYVEMGEYASHEAGDGYLYTYGCERCNRRFFVWTQEKDDAVFSTILNVIICAIILSVLFMLLTSL